MVRSEVAAGVANGAGAGAAWGALDGSCARAPYDEGPLAEVIPLPVPRAPAAAAESVSVCSVGSVGSVEPKLVLTRRGRLVRTFVVAFFIALLALMAAARLGAPGEVETARTAVVGQGQSLTDVAARELPQIPLDEAVMTLRVFNDIGGTSVQAGQALRIPRL